MIKLRLRLIKCDDSHLDLRVTADPDCKVAELAQSLLSIDKDNLTLQNANVTLQIIPALQHTKPEILNPDQRLSDLNLASGIEIKLIEKDNSDTEKVAYFEFFNGPLQGRKHILPVGSTNIGRDSTNGIKINDPMVSKRHARLQVGLERIEIFDLNSANGIIIHGDANPNWPRQSVELQTGLKVKLGNTVVGASFLNTADAKETAEFKKSMITAISYTPGPHMYPKYEGVTVKIGRSPQETAAQPFPWLALFIPIVTGIALYAITKSALSITFVALSPLMMLSTWVTHKFALNKKEKSQQQKFMQTLDRQSRHLANEQDKEIRSRFAQNPSASDFFKSLLYEGTATSYDTYDSPKIWQFCPVHDSFLPIRLGTGEVRSSITLDGIPEDYEASQGAVAAVKELKQKFEYLNSAPIIQDLKKSHTVGIFGAKGSTEAYIRALIAQIAGAVSPRNAIFCAVLSASRQNALGAMKWLPHVRAAEKLFGGSALADCRDSAEQVLRFLEELCLQRVSVDYMTPAVFVFISEDAPINKARLINLLEESADRGIYPVWICDDRDSIPSTCQIFVRVLENGQAVISDASNGTATENVVIERFDSDSFDIFCRRLAAYIDSGSQQDSASETPEKINLLDLLDRDLATDPFFVVDRWNQNGSILKSRNYQAGAGPKLRATVGQTSSGAMQIDLRTHGPHALIGGTTGSGKSEFLQTWVVALAAEYSPQRVTFLFVDYKGGAAFAECTRLPHSVGIVTDLDPHLVNRALVSLKAELIYREKLFARKKVKDITDLENGLDPETPPALIIVIDEFAALVADVPQFIDGVIDIAQRGRSLGIHLVLATQRPSGVINDNLRANTNLRVALRVADDFDSIDVVGDRLAARFDGAFPGRAAVRFSHSNLNVFQTAFVGGRSADASRNSKVNLEVFNFSGEVPIKNAPQSNTLHPSGWQLTDLQLLVNNFCDAAKKLGIDEPRRPWLDELAKEYDLMHLPRLEGAALVFGVQDNPAQQEQRVAAFKPDEEGHIAVFGASGSGKSAMLRTLGVAAGLNHEDDPVHVYGLDSGSGSLSMLECLPHVGAVIDGLHGDRVQRLFITIKHELIRRRQEYSQANASSITQYRKLTQFKAEARLLILIDDLPRFRSEYEAVAGRAETYEIFKQVLAEGRTLGIHCALSSDSHRSFPRDLQENVQSRVVLRLAEDDGYYAFGIPKGFIGSESAPGRAVVNGLEVQTAVASGKGSMSLQAEAIESFAARLENENILQAKPIQAMPAEVSFDDLPTRIEEQATLGISGDTLTPVGFDTSGVFLVAVPSMREHRSILLGLAMSLKASGAVNKFILLTRNKSSLSTSFHWDVVLQNLPEAARFIEEILKNKETLSGATIFIEGVSDYISALTEDTLMRLAACAKNGDCSLIVQDEANNMHTNFGVMGVLKSARTGLAVSPEMHDGELIFKTKFPKFHVSDFPDGRCVYVQSGHLQLVQLPSIRAS